MPRPAAFAVLPQFPSHAAAGVSFNRVRVMLRRTASTALDTTIAFPPTADSLVVRLETQIFGVSETLSLTMAMIDAANDTVYRGGPVPVTLTATTSQPAALPIVLRYVGIGANAKSVVIAPHATSVFFRDSVTLAATAYDSSGLPIPGTPIAWHSLDTGLAKVPADTLGKVLVGIARGTARVQALLPTGVADTAQVTAQPVPVAIGLFSGGGQTGGVGAPLGQPVVVRVKAADSLGVQGIPVTFAVVSGGGVVSKTTDTTDATGNASTVWTLGGVLGVQSVKATVAGIPALNTTVVASGIVGAARKLVFQTQPPAGVVNGALAPAIQVAAQDTFGNKVTGFTGQVTVALGANPGGATLTGTLTQAAVAGVATFANLALTAPDTGYTLVASATGLVNATSTSFTVAAVNLNAWTNAAGGNWSVATNWSKGTVPVATDSVTITVPGTYTVNVDVAATVARLTVGAASGTQTLSVAANALSTLGGAFAANTVLNLSGTGNVTGAGTITTAGAFNWTGGSLGGVTGAGGGIQVLAGGTLSIAPAATASLQGYTLQVAGTGTWTGTATVQTGGGAVLRVASGGSLAIQGDPTFTFALGGAAPALNVVGTLTRTTSANPAVLNVALNDSGTVSVASGTLRLTGGGSSSGAFTVASGATLDFNGGTHALSSASSVGGAGTVRFTGATATLGGGYAVTGPTLVSGGTASFNGSAGSAASLALSGGTLTGTGLLTVSGAMSWTNGSIGAASGAGGTTRVLSGGTLAIAPVVQDSFQNYVLELAGTGTWTGTDTVNTGNGAILRIASGGSLTIQSAQTLIWSLGGAAPAVNVVGTLTSSSAAGTFASLLLPVNDSGTVNVTSGLLILAVGGTSTGAFTIQNGAFLLLGGGTHTLTASSSVTGTGSVDVISGTVNSAGTWNMTSNTFVAGGTLNFNAATAFTNNLGLTSGAVGGSGLVTVGFTLVWKGGNFGPGGGTVKLNAGATDTIAPAAAVQLAGYTLELAGNGVWSTSQTIAMGSGAVLRVDAGATQTITADPTLAFSLGGAAPLLDLQGTLVRSTSANTVTVAVPFNLAGAVSQLTGTINVAGGGTMSGTVTQAAGTVLLYSAGTTTLANKFAVTGSSALTEIVGGTVGGLAATDTAFFDNLTLVGGTIGLAGGTIKTPFEMLWTGPAAVSGGTLFVPATAGLTMSFTTGAPSLQNAKLVIAGSGGWTATTPLSSGSGDTIRVVAGGNLSITGTGAGGGFLYNLGGAPSVLDNRGTVISAATPGTTFTISAAYAQQGGTLDVTSGRLTLAGGRTPPFMGTATVNAGDTLELAGGTFQMDGPLAIGGGGTLLVSGGTLVPNGVGLGLTGNLTTSGTGALVMNNPFDSLEISGNATFGGATGTISNGVIRVGGNFTQLGGASFAPGPNTSPQRVVLTGSGTQTISFANPVASFFRRLQASQGVNGIIAIADTTRASWFQWTTNTTMPGPKGHFIADTITGVATGSSITVNKVEVTSQLNTSGAFAPDTAMFTGSGQTIPNLYAYHTVRVAQSAGTATFAANPATPLANLIVSSGTLDLTGRQVGVTGFFQTTGAGALRMTGATDSLGVGGNVTFGGGSTTGLLTAGVISVGGNFAQSGGAVDAFAPSTAERVLINNGAGALQTVSIASAQSFFDSLVVDRGVGVRGTVQLLSNVRVNRGMQIRNSSDVTGPAARAQIIAGTLQAVLSTTSPTMTNLAIEVQTAPLIGTSPVLVSPDTMVYDGTITTVPTGSGLVYKNARMNTTGAITSPGNITYNGDLIVSQGTYTIGSGLDSIAGFLRTEGTGALSMVAIV
ncbi:MAG TPA: hypothetical protein VEH62_04765, partial [Gemmatimonadales bacterium]|nr:hypothetical protein [Gemmatimonadales bacterium]